MKTNSDYFRRAFVGQAMQILSSALANSERLTRAQLIERTLACRPPAYFVSYEYASRVLHKIMDAPAGSIGRTLRTGMWLELADEVRAVMAMRGLRFCKALTFVLSYRRPSRWYISADHAATILRDFIKVNKTVASNGRFA